MPDKLLPIRRDKLDPIHDFWHTIRWGLVLSLVVWVIMLTLTQSAAS